MASPVFSISNRNSTSGAKKLRFRSSEGTTNPSTSRARITFVLSLGSRKAKTSARSAPGSAATKVASAWSAALMGGAVDKVNEMTTTKARAVIVNFLRLLLKLNMIFLLVVIFDGPRLGGLSTKQALWGSERILMAPATLLHKPVSISLYGWRPNIGFRGKSFAG